MFTSNSIYRAAVTFAAIALALLLAGSVTGQDTLLISYQGRLTDDAGHPITGTKSMTINIYDAYGVSLWTETHPDVEVVDGQVLLVIGHPTGLPAELFDGSHRYLGISIEGADELSPRTLLTSAPGAAISRRVLGDITTAPGSLQIHPPDQCVPPEPCQPALEMLAEPDIHVIRVHPPEPCVPPDPCSPAVELIADTEVHSMKIYPPAPCTPPDPCTPAFDVTVGAASDVSINVNDEIGKVMGTEPSPFHEGYSLGLYDPENGESLLKLSSNYATGESSLLFSIPTERDLIAINSAPSTGVSHLMFNPQPEPPGQIGIEMTTTAGARSENPGGNITVYNTGGTRTSLSGGLLEVGRPDSETAARGTFESNGGVTTLTLASDGAAAPPSQIALVTGAEGASICIGTTTPMEALTVMGNGWFSGDVYTLTDTKVKSNIRQIDDALDKISTLSGYYYDLRTDKFPEYRLAATPQIGLLAQEVREVLPEVVREDNQGMAGVSYPRLTAVLIEAVKELKAENEDLKARIEALERR